MLITAMNSTEPPIPIHFGKDSRIADFVVNDHRAMCVASSLLDAGAYLIDTSLPPENYYTWKSGVRAPCYCNCRNAISDFSARRLISDEMSASVIDAFGDVDAVLGVSTAGIPWASCVADRLELPTAYIRSEKKAHGVGGFVQGHVQPGSRVVIIDDLVASGGSLKMAIDALKDEVDVEVAGVVTIINWGFQKMRVNLEGLTYVALTSYPQIIMAAAARGKVNEAEVSRLLNFYMNPSLGY
jgi:orotate phosphoribosyltransferase